MARGRGGVGVAEVWVFFDQAMGVVQTAIKPVGAAGGYDGGECGLSDTTLSPPSPPSESPHVPSD